MNTFPDFPTESMGGCESFLFTPKNYVNKIPKAANYVISSAIEMLPGYSLLGGIALRDTLQFKETEESTESGSKYKTQITGMVPKLTPEYLALFEEMKQYRHIVIISDNNQNKMICGKMRAGMKFTYSSDSSKSPSGVSGYQFSFDLEYTLPSSFYTAL